MSVTSGIRERILTPSQGDRFYSVFPGFHPGLSSFGPFGACATGAEEVGNLSENGRTPAAARSAALLDREDAIPSAK
jgi:hypothetical protein